MRTITRDFKRQARILKSLAHPARLAMVVYARLAVFSGAVVRLSGDRTASHRTRGIATWYCHSGIWAALAWSMGASILWPVRCDRNYALKEFHEPQ